MNKKNPISAWKQSIQGLVCGRTITEQAETIRGKGNHGMVSALRAGVLAAHGISAPKEHAENCLIFGCYRPFTTPFLLRDYTALLDLFRLDYTYLNDEKCCGLPLVAQTGEEESDYIGKLCKDFTSHNIARSKEKGANKLVYCCAGCAYSARERFNHDHESHIFILDLIFNEIKKMNLKCKPAVMGYFGGCHTYFKKTFPNSGMNWASYRSELSRIEGLELVDVKGMCCKTSAGKIVERAEIEGLEEVICPCNFCYVSLKQAAGDRLKVTSMPEFLLRILKEES